MMSKQRIDTRLNKHTIDKIEEDAKKQKRSKCAIVRNILEEHYESKELKTEINIKYK